MTLATTPSPELAEPMATALSAPERDQQEGTETIEGYVAELEATMSGAIREINDINANTHLLALNARIEAARAGSAGAAFSVVAEEMQTLGSQTSQVANNLANRAQQAIGKLMSLIGSSVRGTRLSDLALTNIDLVDRNLYERTCDVRWWATDSSLVTALTDPTPENFEYASHRLGVILNAYTVYHDLVLCDLEGRVVANGRPQHYPSQGQQVSHSDWFTAAMATRSGDEYGFETAHHSRLVKDQSVLVYSCGVREGGQAGGKLLGVLGILFNWEEFAQTIMQQVPLAENERDSTRCLLCDDEGRLLADSWGKQLSERISLPDMRALFATKKDYVMADYDGKLHCIAHAQAPGFETYSTGWHSVILQPVK